MISRQLRKGNDEQIGLTRTIPLRALSYKHDLSPSSAPDCLVLEIYPILPSSAVVPTEKTEFSPFTRNGAQHSRSFHRTPVHALQSVFLLGVRVTMKSWRLSLSTRHLEFETHSSTEDSSGHTASYALQNSSSYLVQEFCLVLMQVLEHRSLKVLQKLLRMGHSAFPHDQVGGVAGD